MKELVVGKLEFANVSGYYGLALCLRGCKHKIVDIDEKTAWGVDIILTSLFYYRDILFLESFLRKSGMKNNPDRPPIIAGGLQATTCPELTAEMADYVFIGDGEEHLNNILNTYAEKGLIENPYLYNNKMQTVPPFCNCENIEPMAYLFSRKKQSFDKLKLKRLKIKRNRYENLSAGRIYRIEIARGCKYRCPFCLISRIKPYRECKIDKILKVLESIPVGSNVGVFAPEPTSHSNYELIQEILKKRKLRQHAADAKLENLANDDRESVVLGIEGISLKLRKKIGKPRTNEFIAECLENFLTTKSRVLYGARIGMYFILDFPEETEDDWLEFKDLFEKLDKIKNANRASICFSMSPFSPKPFTPLYNSVIHPFRRYDEKMAKLLRGGDGNSRWVYKIIENRIWNCFERTIDAIVHRGKDRGYKIISKLTMPLLNKIPTKWEKAEIIARRLIKEADNCGIPESVLFGGEPPRQ